MIFMRISLHIQWLNESECGRKGRFTTRAINKDKWKIKSVSKVNFTLAERRVTRSDTWHDTKFTSYTQWIEIVYTVSATKRRWMFGEMYDIQSITYRRVYCKQCANTPIPDEITLINKKR